MIPTEVQRIVLLVAMAACGYLLILAWTDDYHSSNPADAAQRQAPMVDGVSPASDTPQVAAPTTAIDAQSPALDPGMDDVPDASLLNPNNTMPTVDAAAGMADNSTANSRLIEVVTPSLQLWIDRLGGDIVRVQLPKFPVDIDQPDLPYLLLDRSGSHTYVAQSGLMGRDGTDSSGERPLFSSNQNRYELLTEEGELSVVLQAEVDGMQVSKRFDLRGDDYMVNVAYDIQNNRSTPIQAAMFAQIKRDSKNPPGADAFSLGPQPYVGGATTTALENYQKLEFDDLDELQGRRVEESVVGGWVAFLQHYFVSAWVGNADEQNQYFARRRNDGLYVFGYVSPAREITSGSSGTWQSRFYAGPKDQDRLEEIAPHLNLTVDYGFLWWLAQPLFQLLQWFHSVVGNWGGAIILLTLLVKLLLYPLSAAAYKSMANMRRVAPQLKRIQERHADDRAKLSQEMMGLYKKEGVNPLGGCIPMLLPMPIFLALYWVLYESVELRHAPFMGCITDLSAMDPWFILPLIMGASMYFQQTLSPQMGDPMQVKMMKMMPVMFTVLFLFFPAGLVLYWVVNNVLGIAQQWWVIKQTEAAAA